MLHSLIVNFKMNFILLSVLSYIPIFYFFVDPKPCEQQVDLCFIIDSSGSITDANPKDKSYDNWELLKKFVASLLDVFEIAPDATRVGAVVFSETVNLEFSLDTYTDAQSVKDAILDLGHMGGETNTPEAFRVATNECFNTARGDRSNKDNLAIFISDGKPHPPETRTEPAKAEAEVLKMTGARVISVGITNNIRETFLQSVSSPPQKEGESYFKAADFRALTAIRKAVAEGTCKKIIGRA